jgi:hypothetical protein
MVFLNGINKFLTFINNNWTSIVVLIGLLVGLYIKIKNFISKSDEERIEFVKVQIKEGMLKMITDAEINFESWNKAGSIKRSQVIKQIYDQYPILSKIVYQEAFIQWVDTEINNSLKTLREIVNNNGKEEEAP